MPTFFAGLGGFIWILVIGAAALIVLALLKPKASSRSAGTVKSGRKQPATPDVFPYERKPSLFTQHELRLYHALVAAFPQAVVHGKTRLEDIVRVERGLDRSDWARYRNHIKSRHIDMVLCDARSGAIHCAIELDDSTHDSARARHADDIKSGALAAAGVPLVRLTGADANVGRLRDLITRYVPVEQAADSARPSKPHTQPAVQPAVVEVGRSTRVVREEHD